MVGMVVRTEELLLDGIVYEITVRDEVTGYYGAWFCNHCWKGGVKYELLPVIPQARAEAKGKAKLHHSQIHSAFNRSEMSPNHGAAARPFDTEH
jgi:hypothetical protein